MNWRERLTSRYPPREAVDIHRFKSSTDIRLVRRVERTLKEGIAVLLELCLVVGSQGGCSCTIGTDGQSVVCDVIV